MCITQPNSQGGDTPHNTLPGYLPLHDNCTGPLLRKNPIGLRMSDDLVGNVARIMVSDTATYCYQVNPQLPTLLIASHTIAASAYLLTIW